MIWFYEAFFPAVWITFLIYWQIKASNTKSTGAVNRPARASCGP
jgi:hypothetical protein